MNTIDDIQLIGIKQIAQGELQWFGAITRQADQEPRQADQEQGSPIALTLLSLFMNILTFSFLPD